MKKVIVSAVIVLMMLGVSFAEREEYQAETEDMEMGTAQTEEEQTTEQDWKASEEETSEPKWDWQATEAETPAQESETGEEQAATEDEETVTQPPMAMLDEILAKKKAELNGTKWGIELKSMVVEKGKVKTETDVVSFSEGKVMSESMSASGYRASGFSSRLEEDGTLIWETMQTSEEDGTAFWRGDIGPDGIMRGVLSKRDLKEKVKDYNFVGKSQ